MGFLARAATGQKAVSFDAMWNAMLGLNGKSRAGPPVTLHTALKVSAALACMRAIAQGCAQVPFKLLQDYEEDGLTRKRAARDHALYDVVTVQPNSWQTSFELRETLAMHASLGNAYVYKSIVRGGKIKELVLLDPSRVQPKQGADLRPIYSVLGRDGKTQEMDASLIWHVRGPSWDGVMGLDTLALAREALGLSMALEESAASLHANGVRPSGVYTVEGNLGKEQFVQLTDWLKKQAAAGTGTPMVLDRSAKWVSQTMTSVDAQHKQMRDMAIEEVARFFGVLPVVIGYTGEKASTYASAVAMFNAHRVHTLDPWFQRIQESADANLLTQEERKQGYYFKFIANGLMRADPKEQGEYFAKALGSGGAPAWMTQDEVRGLLEMDPFGGESAKLPPRSGTPPAEPAPEPT